MFMVSLIFLDNRPADTIQLSLLLLLWLWEQLRRTLNTSASFGNPLLVGVLRNTVRVLSPTQKIFHGRRFIMLVIK